MRKAEHQQNSPGSYSTLISCTELANSGSGPPVTPEAPQGRGGSYPMGIPAQNPSPTQLLAGGSGLARPHHHATSPGRFRQGELLPAQPGPGGHSPAHTRGSTGPGQTPIAGRMQKRLISFPFSPSHSLPWCLPSPSVYPAFCWRVAGAVPGTGSPGAAGAQTPTAEAAARAVAIQPVASS